MNLHEGRYHLRMKHRKEYKEYIIAKNPLGLIRKQDMGMFDLSLAVKYENKEN